MIESLVVGAIVTAAAIYAAGVFLPRRFVSAWRTRAAQEARGAGLARVAQVLDAPAPGGSACGSGCATCGTCARTPAESAVVNTSELSGATRGERI